MTKLFTILQDKDEPPRSNNFKRNKFLIIIFTILILIFISTTIIFASLWRNNKSFSISNKYALYNGIIGFPPLLPNDGKYIQWNILHLNDIYEMLPLDQGRKGGLARVAHLRKLLLKENSQTYTILSGDFLSPSALSQSIVNGTQLNGKQMIASLNTLGLDFVTLGNHEFDLQKSELISRMNESRFTWISSNVFQSGTNQSFYKSISYQILTIDQVKILLIGLTTDDNKPYVDIINKTLLITFVKQFLQSISNIKYDVLIALTHLDLQTDIKLTENIPQIDLILGGHEHEDYYLLRGSKYTPIYKADGNAFTVYIHRCAFNLQTKHFRIYSTLTKITEEIPDEPKTKDIINYWYNLGIQGFEDMGIHPNKTVSCLPEDIQLDGQSVSVRNFETLLTKSICQSLVQSTKEDSTIIAVFNSGSIRIDDVLRGKISEYDILRVLPFTNKVLSLSVPGKILGNILRHSIEIKGDGMFLSYCGIETPDNGKTWFLNGKDISQSNNQYKIGTTDYAREYTGLNDYRVTLLRQYNVTPTQSLINYLRTVYPPC